MGAELTLRDCVCVWLNICIYLSGIAVLFNSAGTFTRALELNRCKGRSWS